MAASASRTVYGWPSSLLNDPGGATVAPSPLPDCGQQILARRLSGRTGDPDRHRRQAPGHHGSEGGDRRLRIVDRDGRQRRRRSAGGPLAADQRGGGTLLRGRVEVVVAVDPRAADRQEQSTRTDAAGVELQRGRHRRHRVGRRAERPTDRGGDLRQRHLDHRRNLASATLSQQRRRRRGRRTDGSPPAIS